MAQRPVAVSLLLCEQVIIEAGTRNVTPVNCFSQHFVKRVPPEPMSFVLLAYLTDGIGEIKLEVVIEQLDTLEEIHRRALTVRFGNPLEEMRCQFQFRNFLFPVVGGYQIQLQVADEMIAQKRMLIVPVGEKS